MITLECKYGKDIEIFGRNQNGIVYSSLITDFNPYFFIKDKFGKLTSIDGFKVSKVSFKDEFELRSKRTKDSYEADLLHVNKYLIDKIDEIKKETIRICYLDIETDSKDGFSSPDNPISPIIVIGLFDSFNNQKTRFELKNYKSEELMLNAFIEYIKKTNPDIIASWFGIGYDFPYILNRMDELGINKDALARNNGKCYVKNEVRGVSKCKIYGRVLFDMLEAYKKHFASGGRESYTLDYISKYELGAKGGKEKYDGTLSELYENDYQKFLKYNDRDVELLVLLNTSLGIIDFFDEIRRVSFCRFEDVFMNSKVADCLCLKYARQNGIVLPSIDYNKSEETTYEGGYVVQCKPQLYENIAVMDFKSMYPSIMIGFNTSYETAGKPGIDIDGKFSFSKTRGIIPSILKPLLDKRAEMKKKLKNLDKSTKEYYFTKLNETAYKVMANSFYGVTGYKKFRLYKLEVASAITYIARKITMKMIEWVEANNYKIIYGDTDSLFLDLGTNNIEDIKNINLKMNEFLKEYTRNYGIDEDYNIFSLEFEKFFSILFFKQKDDGTGAKKKYAGTIVWEGIPCKKTQITGFESKRSDNPQIGRDFIKAVLEMILDKRDKLEIKLYVDKFKKDIINGVYNPEDIGIPVGINKPLEDYENVIHIRASRLANKRHNEGIKNGDKVKFVYIIDPEDNVIAFKNKLYPGYKIDYKEMVRRIIDLKIEPIFRSLNWDYDNKDEVLSKWIKM